MPIDGLWHDEIITGVPVTLTAIDSDGNFVDIGTTISDGYYGTLHYYGRPKKKEPIRSLHHLQATNLMVVQEQQPQLQSVQHHHRMFQ